jgi:fructose-1-phosphate kinase PfkB-like protein
MSAILLPPEAAPLLALFAAEFTVPTAARFHTLFAAMLTTGRRTRAGDAFAAAMTVKTLAGVAPRECLRFACEYAARTCEHAGAIPPQAD